MERTLWDLACDMVVEYVINSLAAPAIRCAAEAAQREALAVLEKELRQVTAERIYSFFRKQPPPPEQIERLSRLFHVDEHFP